MADTGRNNNRGGGGDRRDNNRDDSRGGGGDFDRKRSWRSDNDSGNRGDYQERGAKQMKPGAMGIKALIPSSIVGAIIGKGGEEMKRIKTESGCYVRLSQNDKYFPNSQERPCYIEGEPEEIVKVLEFMQEKVRSDRPPRGNQIGIDQKRKEQLIIIIGPNAAGKCIGKGGENVKRLKSEYNVYVRCMAKEDIIPGLEERTVTISGEQENVSKAAKDILDLALTCKNGGTDKNLDYDQYMGGAPGGAPAGGQFGGQPQGGYNGGNMGNNQYGGNQGNYGGNNYNQPQGGYNAPPAQGGYNAPQAGGFNQAPQQFNSNAPPQGAPPQGQFPPNQGIQQYNQPPPNQYNAPGPVQQYGAAPAQELPPPVLPGVPATPIQAPYGAAPVQQYNNPPPQQGGYTAPAPVNNAPPAASIAVQQYPSQGGYQGAPNGGPGPNQGGYQGNQGGGYPSNNQGGSYQGNQGGGGGYNSGNQGGGYQGANQGSNQGGGYNAGNQGGGAGYQGNRGGGFQGGRGAGSRGNYGGGRGGGRGGRGK